MFQRSDDGFSLVEVLIAMFLLAVISLAVLPLLIGAMRVSVTNQDLASATAFANTQLAPIKASFPTDPAASTTCASLQTRAATGVVGPDGLTAAVTITPCSASAADYPASIPVSVVVTDTAGSALVTLTTRIPVSAP